MLTSSNSRQATWVVGDGFNVAKPPPNYMLQVEEKQRAETRERQRTGTEWKQKVLVSGCLERFPFESGLYY